jgi:hypothetical protein
LFQTLSMMAIHGYLPVNHVPNARSHVYELTHNGPIGSF